MIISPTQPIRTAITAVIKPAPRADSRVIKFDAFLRLARTAAMTIATGIESSKRLPPPKKSKSSKALLAQAWEVILAFALAVDVRRAAMQTAAERISVAQLDFDDLHAQFIHLLGLIDLGFLDADGFGVKHQHVHAEPCRGIAQRRG